MILTVTANPSLDRTYTTGPLLLGEVNRAFADTVEASGKGVNVSRALHAAGTATLAVLTVGGTEGEQLRRLLDADGLPYAPVPVAAGTRTNTTVAEAGGRTTKVNSSGAALAPAECDALVAAVARHAAAADWAVFSGTLPPGAGPDLLPRMLDAARTAGARTAVDTSGEALAVAARHGVDLLAPNAAELASLTGRAMPESVPDALAAARAVGGALLVSLGAAGALWIDGDTALHAVSPPVIPVNTAGAGDALLAGWLCRTDDPPARRLARAVAWGTAACLMAGTAGDVAARADLAAVTMSELAGAGRQTGNRVPGTGAPG